MRYRKAGDSPLQVSEISFGTGDNAGGIIYSPPSVQRAMVERALELGITTFDCSPDYGKGLGEANLGRVLREVGSPEVVITTKVEIMPEDLGRIRDRIHESVNDSLLRLGRECVNVIMLHNSTRQKRNPSIRKWTPLTPADILDQVLPAFEELRSAGKVAHFGLCCESNDTAALRTVLATRRIALVNVWYNLVNPSAARAVGSVPPSESYLGTLDLAAEFGVGVAVIRALAGGVLTAPVLEKGRAGVHEFSGGTVSRVDEFDALRARGRAFAFLHRPPDQAISEAAIRFVLEESRVSTVIGGFSDIFQIEDAVRAAERGPLSSADSAAINAVFASG